MASITGINTGDEKEKQETVAVTQGMSFFVCVYSLFIISIN
jgi:hypothetical protein